MSFIKFFIVAIIVSTALNVSAQDKLAYIDQVDNAHSLYKDKNFKSSALRYTIAIKNNRKYVRFEDLYNAACSWALAGNRDSSFFFLYKLVKEYHYPGIGGLLKDGDFKSLRQDDRWRNIIDEATRNKDLADAKLNKPLMAILDTIYDDDQVHRWKIDSIQKTCGMQSVQYKRLWDTINYNDSINVIKVENIIKRYGWPGIDVVGEKCNKAIWLVIQHAGLKKQIKYLALLKKSVEKRQSRPSYLALMEDRILMYQDKKQIYGSQYEFDDATKRYKLYSIDDERNVDKRRKLMGLPPIEQEAKTMGVDYKLPL